MASKKLKFSAFNAPIEGVSAVLLHLGETEREVVTSLIVLRPEADERFIEERVREEIAHVAQGKTIVLTGLPSLEPGDGKGKDATVTFTYYLIRSIPKEPEAKPYLGYPE